MRSILTITTYADIHAVIMAEALARLGGKNHIWNISSFPREQSIICKITNESSDVALRIADTENGEFAPEDYDVIWFRRPLSKRLYSKDIFPDDLQFIRNETGQFVASLFHSMNRRAFWINSVTGKARADAKLFQLLVAVECGLTIPDTLMTNHAEHLREFAATQGAVINKSFHGSVWTTVHKDGRVQSYANYTSLLDGSQIDDKSVALCPSIYQGCTPKKFELRILLCGSTLLAVKIDSQADEKAAVDFRPAQHTLSLTEYPLPAELQQKILTFARKIGIVFGSLDFIVTPDDEYIFLEVNEQGQFLWIEENNPEIPVLQLVADFMLYGDEAFVWSRPEKCLKLSEVETDELRARFRTEMERPEFIEVTPRMVFEEV